MVDEGSFAKAAEVLNKSQSSVSYTLARMEEQLPTPVLVIRGRKAEFDARRRSLYLHASTLLAQASGIEEVATYLASGWEAEVVLAVDALAPIDAIFCRLQHFFSNQPEYAPPPIGNHLVGHRRSTAAAPSASCPDAKSPTRFMGKPIAQIMMLPVAAPTHPLAQLNRPISEVELKQHRQVVMRDTGQKRQQDAGWLGSEQRWTVTHPATSIAAVKSGLGFAFLPDNRIVRELKQGELKRLQLEAGGERVITLYLVIANQDFAGPATRAVVEELSNLKVDNLMVKF